ncbi:MAG TPA: hypothetical protein VD731_04430 [Nitrosopumilaceae archaeon]|nr:hypothetical protein [Nitrosopumilaceae archaeon]
MKQKYKEYFKLNKNILAGFAASFIISAIVAQLLVGQEDYLNTSYTLLVDYVVYFSVFGGLYYLDNRKKYRLESGQTDKIALRRDLIKIITSLGIAEVVYTIARWVTHYYLLTLHYDPYIASMISQGISTIVYMIVVNLSVIMTRLYKDAN